MDTEINHDKHRESDNTGPGEFGGDVVAPISGNLCPGVDSYQVVHPQKPLWVLDLRLVADDEASLVSLAKDWRDFYEGLCEFIGGYSRHLLFYSATGPRPLNDRVRYKDS